jgi:hypothetical protein
MRRMFKVLAAVLGGGALITGVATAASSPAVITGGHSSVKQTSAVLQGTVNPNGSHTTYYFRWGLTNAYGVNGSPHSAGSGTKPVAPTTTATGLIPGTAYHYQLIATNKYGTAAGTDRTFTTAGHPPPAATTGPATQIGTSFATLTGVINPQGQQTTWSIQWGTTINYGSSTFGGTLAAGSSPQTVASPLQGLASGTIFHYRLAAQHPGSSIVSYGADQSFMSYPSPRPLPRLRAHTGPHRKRKQPFAFTTSGSVGGPSWIPQGYACNGQVRIRSFLGRKQVGFAVAQVQPNCTYSGETTFAHKPGRGPKNRQVTLNVFVRYLGTGYLAQTKPQHETIVLG